MGSRPEDCMAHCHGEQTRELHGPWPWRDDFAAINALLASIMGSRPENCMAHCHGEQTQGLHGS